MANKLKLGIAIPTFNREEVLIDTIKYVLEQDCDELEVLIVDQSESHSAAVQSQLDLWHSVGRIRYIRHFPAGLPGARNRALKETSSDVLIFIDDDVTFDPGFAKSHLKNFLDDPAVMAVAGRVVQRLGYPEIQRPSHWPQLHDYRYFRMDGTTRAENIANFQGGNHSIRVAYARALDGYDEGYKGVALREETDFALRIFLAGGKIVYDPTASLFHIAAPSGGCRRKNSFDVSAGVSAFRFYWKFRSTLGLKTSSELWRSARLSVLTKGLMKKPYLLPAAGFLYVLRLFSVMLQVRPAARGKGAHE